MGINLKFRNKNELGQKFKIHINEIIDQNLRIVLSVSVLTVAYFMFSDLYFRDSVISFYTRILPFSFGFIGLVLHFISVKRKNITLLFFNLFLLTVPMMMYALLFIFMGTETFNETITATILAIFLISLILMTRNLMTLIIYFLPFTVFIILFLIFYDITRKEILEIINIIPMLCLGFVGNRIHYNLRYKNFKANYLLNIEKGKTEELYSETLSQNEQLNEFNEEIISQKQEIETQAAELKEQTKELKATNKKLKKLDDFKERMTGMIVHDLKNPLNAIIGLAKDEIVQKAGEQMLNMVLNILDVYKYKDAEIKLNTNDHSICQISKSAIHQVDYLCKMKNLNLENRIQNYIVKVDREIIERIFVNILSNAVKFTPNNGSIILESSKKSEDFILIKVSDTGIGIPGDKIDNVFRQYEQVPAKGSGVPHSTGIGLTFCKLFIDAHGGEIGVESEEGKGTVLWFTLPVGEQGSEEIEVKEETTEKIKIELSKSDKEVLSPFLLNLKELEVFETTNIRKIIEQIDFSKSKNLKYWKAEIDNALYNLNEEKYKELIDKIK